MTLKQSLRLLVGLPAGPRHNGVGQDALARNFAIDVHDKDNLHKYLSAAITSGPTCYRGTGAVRSGSE
jgi:hypothetical protein